MVAKTKKISGKRVMFLKLNNEKRGWIFIIPAFIFLMLLYIFPLIQSFIKSFLNSSGEWNSFINYSTLIKDTIFWVSLKNTFLFTVASVILHLLIGLFLAILLNLKLNPAVMNFFRGILILPWLVATVVAGSIWKLIYHPVGILNYILTTLHILKQPISWLGDPKLALMAVVLVNVWKYYPLFFVTLLAGLKTIPNELYEAAEVDGAKAYQSFFHITLPSLKEIIVFMGLLDFIWTLRHFDLVYIMTGGGPMDSTELLSHYIYQVSFRNLQLNYGSTIAEFALIISLIFSVVYLYINRRREQV